MTFIYDYCNFDQLNDPSINVFKFLHGEYYIDNNNMKCKLGALVVCKEISTCII